MVRVKPFACLIILSLFAALCAVEELGQVTGIHDSSLKVVRTKSAPVVLSRKDSLRLIYEHQSRGDVFVLNHLTGSKGRYSLEISRNDAIALGVAPEVYDFYNSFVEQLNQNNND